LTQTAAEIGTISPGRLNVCFPTGSLAETVVQSCPVDCWEKLVSVAGLAAMTRWGGRVQLALARTAEETMMLDHVDRLTCILRRTGERLTASPRQVGRRFEACFADGLEPVESRVRLFPKWLG
jgi:hypothetical protein